MILFSGAEGKTIHFHRYLSLIVYFLNLLIYVCVSVSYHFNFYLAWFLSIPINIHGLHKYIYITNETLHFLPFSLILLHQIALHQWHKTSQKEIFNFYKIFYRDDVTHWINSPPFILEHLDYFQLLFIYVNIVIHHLFIFLNIIFLCLGAETKLVNSTFFFFWKVLSNCFLNGEQQVILTPEKMPVFMW